jgi:hypothetical protein
MFYLLKFKAINEKEQKYKKYFLYSNKNNEPINFNHIQSAFKNQCCYFACNFHKHIEIKFQENTETEFNELFCDYLSHKWKKQFEIKKINKDEIFMNFDATLWDDKDNSFSEYHNFLIPKQKNAKFELEDYFINTTIPMVYTFFNKHPFNKHNIDYIESANHFLYESTTQFMSNMKHRHDFLKLLKQIQEHNNNVLEIYQYFEENIFLFQKLHSRIISKEELNFKKNKNEKPVKRLTKLFKKNEISSHQRQIKDEPMDMNEIEKKMNEMNEKI